MFERTLTPLWKTHVIYKMISYIVLETNIFLQIWNHIGNEITRVGYHIYLGSNFARPCDWLSDANCSFSSGSMSKSMYPNPLCTFRMHRQYILVCILDCAGRANPIPTLSSIGSLHVPRKLLSGALCPLRDRGHLVGQEYAPSSTRGPPWCLQRIRSRPSGVAKRAHPST